MTTLVLVAVLLLAPGAIAVRVLTEEPLLRVLSIGAPCSILLWGTAGAVLAALDRPATLLSGAICVAVLLGIIAALSRSAARHRTGDDPARGTTLPQPAARVGGTRQTTLAWVGVGVGIVVGAAVWGPPSHWLPALPQHYDYLWHQYVTATIQRRGLLGPQVLTPLDPLTDLTTGYQHGAHLIAGLVSEQSAIGVATAINATLWVVSCLVLPLGVTALVQRLSEDRGSAVLVAGALAGAAPGLLFQLLGLFPFLVGVGLVPGVVLAFVLVVDGGRGRWLVSTAALAGLAIVHPQPALGAGLIVACLGAEQLVRRRTAWARTLGRVVSAAVVAGIVSAPWMLSSDGVSGASEDLSLVAGAGILRSSPFDGYLHVLGGLVRGSSLQHSGLGAPNLLYAGVVLGACLVLLARRRIGLVAALLVTVAITTETAAGSGASRDLVGGIWLGDWYRPGALAALLAVCIAALGLGEAAAWATARTSLRAAERRPRRPGSSTVALLVLGVLTAAIVGPALRNQEESVDKVYRAWWESRSVAGATPAAIGELELEAMEHLARITPDGARVLSWWRDGSVWMYSAEGLASTITYSGTSSQLKTARFARDHLLELELNPAVIDSLVELRVCSLFAGEGTVSSHEPPPWHGATSIPGFELVYENPHARVFRVTHPELRARCDQL